MPTIFNDLPLRKVYGAALLSNIDSMLKVFRDTKFRPVPVMTEQAGVISLTANEALAILDQTLSEDRAEKQTESIVHVKPEDFVCVHLNDRNLKEDTLFVVSDENDVLGSISAQEILVHLTPSIVPRIQNLSLSNDFVLCSMEDSIYSVHTQLYRERKKTALVHNDTGEICGLISDFYLGQLVEKGCDIWNTKAGKCTQPTVCVSEEVWLKDAYSRALSVGGETIVVNDSNGAIKGTVPLSVLENSFGLGECPSHSTCRRNESDALFLNTALTKSLQTGIVGTDENLSIIYFNEAMVKFFEKPDQLTLGSNFVDIAGLCNISGPRLGQAIACLDLGGHEPINSWCIVDGVKKVLELRISSLPNENEVCGFVFTLQDKTEQHNAENAIRRLAYSDQLTRLPNRAMLQERLDVEIKRAKRAGTKVALMMLDLNGFKNVNDTYGHAVGDKLLIKVGERLDSCIRETDMVARFGGDEFIFLLPEMVTEKDVDIFATRVREQLAGAIIIDGISFQVSGAIGYAFYPDSGECFEDLLRYADSNMYRDKKGFK